MLKPTPGDVLPEKRKFPAPWRVEAIQGGESRQRLPSGYIYVREEETNHGLCLQPSDLLPVALHHFIHARHLLQQLRNRGLVLCSASQGTSDKGSSLTPRLGYNAGRQRGTTLAA